MKKLINIKKVKEKDLRTCLFEGMWGKVSSRTEGGQGGKNVEYVKNLPTGLFGKLFLLKQKFKNVKILDIQEN